MKFKSKKYKHYIPDVNIEEFESLELHLYTLVIRKSTFKLMQYIDAFSCKDDGRRNIIDIKYKLSQCREEVLAIMLEMTKDPERFHFDLSFDSSILTLVDSKTYVRFTLFNYNGRISISINNEKFLTDTETKVMREIILSLRNMSENQYKLQAELERLETEKNVFEIYTKAKQ